MDDVGTVVGKLLDDFLTLVVESSDTLKTVVAVVVLLLLLCVCPRLEELM